MFRDPTLITVSPFPADPCDTLFDTPLAGTRGTCSIFAGTISQMLINSGFGERGCGGSVWDPPHILIATVSSRSLRKANAIPLRCHQTGQVQKQLTRCMGHMSVPCKCE
jgi:hypothetical protein